MLNIKVHTSPLSSLIAMLYFNGSDAAVAVADTLLAQAGALLVQVVAARINEGEQVLPIDNLGQSRGKQIDRYRLENVLMERDPVIVGIECGSCAAHLHARPCC